MRGSLRAPFLRIVGRVTPLHRVQSPQNIGVMSGLSISAEVKSLFSKWGICKVFILLELSLSAGGGRIGSVKLREDGGEGGGWVGGLGDGATDDEHGGPVREGGGGGGDAALVAGV